MTPTHPVVAVLGVEAADDPALVGELVELINHAYSTAERGMWTRDLPRTTPDEVAVAITSSELGAVRLDERFVGSVFTRLLDARTGWFGALAVDPAHGGRGLGRQLVDFAEQRTRGTGADAIQLELLVPATSHPHTERLAMWYAGLGYHHIEERDLAEIDPASVVYAVVPIHASVMRKSLGRAK